MKGSYSSFLVDKFRYNPNKKDSFFPYHFMRVTRKKEREFSFPASVSGNICDRMQYTGSIWEKNENLVT